MISFDAGARAEGDSFSPGLAHMLEHMIYKGTERRTCSEIVKEIAFLGGRTNAFTSYEKVVFYITVPYENIEPAMDILSDMVFNSTFPEEEFLKEREVVREEEASSNDNVSSFLWDAMCDEFFTGKISVPIIGTPESIDGFSRKELVKFYKKFYRKSGAVVSLCGNHSKREAKRLMTQYFGRSTGKMSHNVPFEEQPYGEERVVELYKPALEHTYVWMCFPGILENDIKTEATIDLMNSILGVGMDSRLFENVREQHGLVYGIGSEHISFRDCGTFLITASTRGENLDKMISVINQELGRMKEEPVSEEELQRAKNKFRSSAYGVVEQSIGLAKWNLSRAFFEQGSLEDLSEAANQVTPEDIQRVAALLLDDSKRLTIVCSGGKAE